MEDNLHTRINNRPHVCSESCPSSATGREEVAFKVGIFGSYGMEVKERDFGTLFPEVPRGQGQWQKL